MIKQMTFQSAHQANKVLNKLTERADYCGHATVADLYEASGKKNDRPNYEYGWLAQDMNKAYIEHFNDRHTLRLPEPRQIDEI